MIRRARDKGSLGSLRIHSSLEPKDYQRLTALAARERSSVSRMVKLAVLEFLDRDGTGGVASRRADADKQTRMS